MPAPPPARPVLYAPLPPPTHLGPGLPQSSVREQDVQPLLSPLGPQALVTHTMATLYDCGLLHFHDLTRRHELGAGGWVEGVGGGGTSMT